MNKKIPIWEKLQTEYNKIHRFFKTTTEFYDDLDWDGKVLNVFLNDKIIETYTKKNLIESEIL